MSAVREALARAGRIRDVSEQTIKDACARHGVSDIVALGERRADLYRAYLRYCFADHLLSEDELTDLVHLRRVLRMPDSAIEMIHRRVARDVYARSVDDVLADDRIDADERAFLLSLRERLAIPEAVADNIIEVKQRQRQARRGARR